MGVTIDPTAAGDHKPTAERNNRTLKERVRVALARLPYKVVPKVITECLGCQAAELLNVFPQKDSISSHFSPQQLIDNVNINYKSDMVAELGQYVHAIGTDSSNLMEPQSIKAIYIEPTKGQRTGHQVLNLNTKKMISRPKVVVLPVTDQVIQRVEAWAAAEGVTSMKFFDKKRDLETFQDGNQIAGVDDTEQGYLEEAFDQDNEPEDEDECDFNLHGQFDDIDDSEREELLADADNDVHDMPELTVRFQGDDDYESDKDSGDEGNEEEEPIVADLDHHQENVDRGSAVQIFLHGHLDRLCLGFFYQASCSGRGSHSKKADRPKQYHPHNPDFTHEQVTIYLLEAIALKSLDYAQDMIWSVRNMAHVDFKALRGTQTVYKPGKNDSKFFKSSRQAQLDRNWENLNVKIDKREVIYTTNQYTVAAIITKHFITQAMRDKLSNETDWLDLKEDHVMLLKRIKTFMTITDETKWQHFGLMESLKRFTNCTQKQNESVNGYRRRFEAQADHVFEILGTDVLHVYATKTMGYLDLYDSEADPDDIKALQETFKKAVLGTFKASAFFYNCDRSRFQSMLDKANQTYAMEFKEYDQRNKYPPTIDQVAKALIKHKPDNRKKGPTTPRPTPSATTASSSAPDGVSNAQANA
ncbi:unnamed protein product [Cylindrotheca closterium]|uniref:Uncharacterized protein n=1 Tax=Cylindrotheca closterium TaxID=2856 RepID=A0AAD2PX09_9STRA|nr:unnamed protein product [Cylindrotheca closterium]